MIKNFKLLFHWLANKNQYLKKERKYLPDLIYPSIKLLGREYHSQKLNTDIVLNLLNTAEEYATFLPQEMQEERQDLAFSAEKVRQKLPKYKNNIHFDEIGIHYGDEAYGRTCYSETKNGRIDFVKPYYISLFNTWYPQNYFVVYFLKLNKIEVRTNQINTDDVNYHELIGKTKEVTNVKTLQQIEESIEAYMAFAKFVISEEKRYKIEKKAKEKTQKQKKLFATTDVLQRAKAIYDLLKIPQDTQQAIIKGIEDENDILNFNLYTENYTAYEDYGWLDKEDLNYENFWNRYGLTGIFEEYDSKHPDFTHNYLYMLGIGKKVLKHGKTLCCFADQIMQYAIIDSKDREQLKKATKSLADLGEFKELIFFDEIEQHYPLPIELYSQIYYEFKPHKNRSLSDIKTDLLTYNTDVSDSVLARLLNYPLPIYTDIKVKIVYKDEQYNFDEKLVLIKPKSGFTLANTLHQLEQKIAELFGYDDTFILNDFELQGYDDDIYLDDTYFLKIESKNNRRKQKNEAYKNLIELLVTDKKEHFIILQQAEKLIQQGKDDWEILYELKSFSSAMNIDFIIHLDWKSPLEELDEYLSDILKLNYPNLRIKLPTAKDYDEETAVGTEGVFDDYSNALKKYSLQLGFIDTQSDDYIGFVHQISDKDKIIRIIEKIGFDYFEMEE